MEPGGQIGVLSARNSAKNSAKFFDEMSIRLPCRRLISPTASGNLVVDRTDLGCWQSMKKRAPYARSRGPAVSRRSRTAVGRSLGSPYNQTHLLHEFRGIVNLERPRPAMLQIDDQVLSPAYCAGKDEPLEDRCRKRSPSSIDGVRSSGARQLCRTDSQRLRQSPLGQVQHPVQRDVYTKDDAADTCRA